MQQTLDRVSAPHLFENAIIVCAQAQAEMVGAAAPQCGLIIEPVPRGSAAAVALAAHRLPAESIMLVLPSDHHVSDPSPLYRAIEVALPATREGRLVTFGIKPFRPETGYGYIEAGPPIAEGVLKALGFVEKPAREKAAELISSGHSYWNSGMFMFTAGAFLRELERHAPEIHDATRAAIRGAATNGLRTSPDVATLAQSPTDSIDYAVMEHSDRIAVVPLDMGWSDVGNWSAVFDLADKDANENVLDDRSHALGARNCLIRSSGPKVIAIGVEDLVIVATAEHILVVPRSDAQRVREAADIASGSAAAPSSSDS
jgi:mannose-1-phosphate guanylyltransferase/mannose-1-phosphate guanylyltransferase/mannose-6-phosphate isomerase